MAGNILNNLAVVVVWEGDFRRPDDIYQEAQAIAERFGDRDMLRFTRANGIHTWWVLGKWDEASDASDRFIVESESSPSYGEGIVRRARGAIRLARGDTTAHSTTGSGHSRRPARSKTRRDSCPRSQTWR